MASPINPQSPIDIKNEPKFAHFKQEFSDTLYWIRGIAIALVVIGHVIGFDRNYGMRQYYNDDLSWLGYLGDGINTIHMPTFFIASGLATDFFSRGIGSYRSFFTQKIPKLLVPLVCWAPPFFIVQSFLKNRPIDIWSIFASIYQPYEIFWFLHALIFAVTFRFLISKVLSSKWFYVGMSVILMGLSFLPSFNTLQTYFYWNLFFSLGIIMSSEMPMIDEWVHHQSRWLWIAIILMCIGIIVVVKIALPLTSQLLEVRLFTALPGFILFYLLCCLSRSMTNRMMFPIAHSSVAYMGMMSMVIYLFHGYFTRFSSLMIAKFLGQIPPIEYFLILSSVGIVAPLLLNALILKRNPILAYITGGK